jgi:hypothetical protein
MNVPNLPTANGSACHNLVENKTVEMMLTDVIKIFLTPQTGYNVGFSIASKK